MELIDKSALVAEIKSLMRITFTNFDEGVNAAAQTLLETIDTLDVKEVDLEKEIELVKGDYEQVDVAWNNDFDYIAKHFFALGLKAKKQNRIMTQEEKARAYDKAIEKIKYVMEHGVSPTLNKEDLQDIFPTLREFDDERIIKAQLDYWRSVGGKEWHGVPVQETIAWLEKQGKASYFMTPEESLGISSEKYNEIVNECIFGKDKPKFKDGDWITNSVETVQITGYDIDYGYQVDYKGNLQHRDTDIIEKDYHLWTIQDAEEGDVLDANDAPFIYKKHDKDYVYSYCGINLAGEFIETNGNDIWNSNNKVYPATKEQRDLLFSKIKEAGYEWDTEKKELRKIEKQVDGFDAELNALLKKYEHLPKEEILGCLNFYVLVLGKEMEGQQ